MDLIEAVKRTDEVLAQLHSLAGMLRDDYPDQNERIHLLCWHLRKLRDQLLDEMEV